MLSRLRRVMTNSDVALDLGTANTLLCVRDGEIITNQPSTIEVNLDGWLAEQLKSDSARDDAGNGHSVVVRPVTKGVVTDIEAASTLLKPMLLRFRRFGLGRPRVLACTPADASDFERSALIKSIRGAGASQVAVVPEPLAAAIGAGLDMSSPYARMLVDIGDGVTDVAVIRSGEIISTATARTACSDLHAAVLDLMAGRYRVWLLPREAERLSQEFGAGHGPFTRSWLTAIGVDCLTGCRKSVAVSGEEISEALTPVVDKIVGMIVKAVRDLPDETACEVIESRICLTGGGACLPGMAARIASQTLIDVSLAPDPLRTVIRGAQQMLASDLTYIL
jgi:rod shape-determining protein MreB